MILAQLSDLHVAPSGSVYDTDLRTAAYLAAAVELVASHRPAPDAVILTGDLVEGGTAEEYARLRAILARQPMPVFAVPGNHDARGPMREVFADQAWARGEGEFVQFVAELGPLRLIGLDTHVPGAPHGELCARRLAWLEAQLAAAPSTPTVVAMHHPPFASGIASMDAFGLRGAEAFAAIVARHPQVERIVCGHLHRPITRRLAGTVVMTCPSPAHQLALTLAPSPELAFAMEPPACIFHAWDAASGALVSHGVSLEPPGPRLTVFDGERWHGDARVPPRFHRH